MSAANDQSLADFASLFDVLSDKTRMHLVFLLAKGDRDVTSLCEELKLKQPTVSHHLGLLRMNGVVVTQRNGKQIIYSLAGNIGVSGGKLKISMETGSVTVEGW